MVHICVKLTCIILLFHKIMQFLYTKSCCAVWFRFFYIYFDHTNFFIFINSYYLNLHLYFGNIFLNILVPQVRCSPRMVQVACGGTTPVVVQKGGSQLSATIERKCRLVGAEPMIGAETENENKTFGPSGGAWFEIDRSEANKRATLNQLCPPRA